MKQIERSQMRRDFLGVSGRRKVRSGKWELMKNVKGEGRTARSLEAGAANRGRRCWESEVESRGQCRTGDWLRGLRGGRVEWRKPAPRLWGMGEREREKRRRDEEVDGIALTESNCICDKARYLSKIRWQTRCSGAGGEMGRRSQWEAVDG